MQEQVAQHDHVNKDQYDKIKGLTSADRDLELKLNNLLVRLDAMGAPQVATSETTGGPSPDFMADFERKLKEH